MSKSKDSTESAAAAANVTQPTPEQPKIEQPETTEPKTKYIPATGLEDYGRWKTMFKDRKANPNVTEQQRNQRYFCFIAQGVQGKDSHSFCRGHFCSKLH